MSMHKQMIGKIGPGSASNDVTLADYIARKEKAYAPRLTFSEWYLRNELQTYDKTEYECMEMAWNASRDNI